ncbi:MAG TPA: glycosyltransferase [Thermoanaerobaculia bacterium]
MTRRIRLLWLLDSLNVGGAEALTVSFARNIDRARYELFVCYLKSIEGSPIEEQLRAAGATVVKIGARNLRDLAAFRRLLRFVRDEKIDLIHAHLTYSAIWASLVARLTRVPALATLHVAPPAGRGRHAMRDRILRFVLNRWGTAAVMVSDSLRNDYLAGGGLAARKMRTLHNGIDLGRFARDRDECRARIAAAFDIPRDAPLVITVSVLRAPKGIDVLLQAARSIPDAWFLIVGDGEMREAWPRLAQELGVADRVRWAGYRADVDALLAGCDLFVLPTRADAFPTVLMEAMAAGLPVVASDDGGVPEIVERDVTGTLVPVDDSNALASAITTLLGDAALRARMSAAAKQSVQQRFSTEAWIARLGALYDEALGAAA